MAKPNPGRSSPNGYLPGQIPKLGTTIKRATVELGWIALIIALVVSVALLLA